MNCIFRGLWRTAHLKCVGTVPAGRGAGAAWVQAVALGGDARSNVASEDAQAKWTSHPSPSFLACVEQPGAPAHAPAAELCSC